MLFLFLLFSPLVATNSTDLDSCLNYVFYDVVGNCECYDAPVLTEVSISFHNMKSSLCLPATVLFGYPMYMSVQTNWSGLEAKLFTHFSDDANCSDSCFAITGSGCWCGYGLDCLLAHNFFSVKVQISLDAVCLYDGRLSDSVGITPTLLLVFYNLASFFLI